MEKISLPIDEYKATQEFVIHYERLIWYIGSILNAGVFVLAGLVFNDGEILHFIIVWIVSVIVSFIWYQIACRFRDINVQKLVRLHDLEGVLGFRQSLDVRDYDENNQENLTAHDLTIITSILIPVAIFLFLVVKLLQNWVGFEINNWKMVTAFFIVATALVVTLTCWLVRWRRNLKRPTIIYKT